MHREPEGEAQRREAVDKAARGIRTFTVEQYTDHLDDDWRKVLRDELEALYDEAYEAGYTIGYDRGLDCL